MDKLKIGLAQFAPVWMNREKTLEKTLSYAADAANQDCEFVVLGGEACVGGYPYWLELTDGARFNSQIQREIFAEYSNQAVQIERGDLQAVCDLAREKRIAIYVGIVEKPAERGESLYAALVFIDRDGEIKSVQRKLVPTYEERLVWANGDGNGLRVHSLNAFTVGGLNCWENWNPSPAPRSTGKAKIFTSASFPAAFTTLTLQNSSPKNRVPSALRSARLCEKKIFRPTQSISTKSRKTRPKSSPPAERASPRPTANGLSNHSARKKNSSSPKSITKKSAKNAKI